MIRFIKQNTIIQQFVGLRLHETTDRITLNNTHTHAHNIQHKIQGVVEFSRTTMETDRDIDDNGDETREIFHAQAHNQLLFISWSIT